MPMQLTQEGGRSPGSSCPKTTLISTRFWARAHHQDAATCFTQEAQDGGTSTPPK